MIINWEQGKRFYAGSSEMLERELFTFANINAPKGIDKCSQAYSNNNKEQLKEGLEDLRAASS